MAEIDEKLFVGRWKYAPAAEDEAGFYEFLHKSGLSEAPVGTAVIVEFSVNSGFWTQTDTFEGVNTKAFNFQPGVSESYTTDDGIAVSSQINIEGKTWKTEKTRGADKYSKVYKFDGDTMNASYKFVGGDGTELKAQACFQRQN